MFFICIPNIIHDYINIVNDEYNINIDIKYAHLINGYYFYQVHEKLNSNVSFLIKTYDGESYLVSSNINYNDYNTILIKNDIYDNGVAQIYNTDNELYVLIKNTILEIQFDNLLSNNFILTSK
jgi:hypothetical protein